MSDTTSQTACCSTAPAPSRTQDQPTGSAPCCGSVQDPTEAQACCAPAAKQEAQATGATCC